MNNLGFFQIQKADASSQEVYLTATDESIDNQNQSMDYDSSKPYFENWSNSFFVKTDGKSYGNIRLQHDFTKPIGKVAQPLEFDDVEKKINAVIKVVDPAAWTLVEEGVLTGASIAGKAVKRWYDPITKVQKYTVNPQEISLVDLPCNPDAKFILIKVDGSSEECSFNKVEKENAIMENEIKPDVSKEAEAAVETPKTVEKTVIPETTDSKMVETSKVVEPEISKTVEVKKEIPLYVGDNVNSIVKAAMPAEVSKVFGGSDAEKRQALYGALSDAIKVPFKLVNNDADLYFWINSIYADYVIIEADLEGNDSYKYFKYNYTMDESGKITITDDGIEVKLEFIPVTTEVEKAVKPETIEKPAEPEVKKAAVPAEKPTEPEVKKTVEPEVKKTAEPEVQKALTSETVIDAMSTSDLIEKVGAKISNANITELQKVSHAINKMGGACKCADCSTLYVEEVEKATKPEVIKNDVDSKISALEKAVSDLSTINKDLVVKVTALEKMPDDTNAPKTFAIDDKTLIDSKMNVQKAANPKSLSLEEAWNTVKSNPVVRDNFMQL